MPIRFFVVLLGLMASVSNVLAQAGGAVVDTKGVTPLAKAKNLFDMGDYKNAQLEYINLLAEKPEDEFLNYRLGLCHLRQNINKSWSISYLRKVVNMPKFDNEALYEMGLAYMYNEQIDSALLFFNKYVLVATDPVRKVDVTRQIEFCGNAKKFMKEAVNVTFENLGKDVNSNGPDLNPMVPLDQSFLLYTTKRDKGVMGNNLDFDGYKPPDVFMVSSKNGQWGKAKSVSPVINSEWVEELAGISAYGDHMFIMVDNLEATEDVWMSTFSGRSFSKPSNLGGYFVTDELVQAASCTPDGQTIFFSLLPLDGSGFGELDLFMARKLPDGQWGVPENLGPTVNTQYNESYPLVSHDGKTLYFCSQGHRSMGGYDIFKSVWDDKMQRWERPVNLGYPINNTMDNLVFSPTDDPKVGYTSQLRQGGLGDLDIYRVVFGDPEQRMSTVVIDLEVMTGPEKDLLKVHEWKSADGQVKWFPVEIGYQPEGKEGYTYMATKDIEVKDGEAYEFTFIGAANGGEVGKFDLKTFPKGAGFDLVDVRVKKIKVAPKGVKPTIRSLKGNKALAVTATVTDQHGNNMGDYLPNYNTGRIVAVLAPGQVYEFTITADGFQPVKEKVYVMDLSEYKSVVPRAFMLVENGLEKP
ncbi:MAG: hypothetical protein K9J06_12340 [Flavobacteriales bacterium]|nr:hypothetical protein [Flavobacteriales bacterium]